MTPTLLLALLTLLTAQSSNALSCGESCLFFLLEDQGRPCPADEARLFVDEAGGKAATVAQLQAAAWARGVRLQARRIRNEGPWPFSPMIVHVLADYQDAYGLDVPTGHFIYLRPVDRKGEQYQVLDPPSRPYVATRAEIGTFFKLTGWALVPVSFITWHELAIVSSLLFSTLTLVEAARCAWRPRTAPARML